MNEWSGQEQQRFRTYCTGTVRQLLKERLGEGGTHEEFSQMCVKQKQQQQQQLRLFMRSIQN